MTIQGGLPQTPDGEMASPTTSPTPCPLENCSPELHQYIHHLESRLTHAENELARFSAALVNAGQFIFDSPMSKTMLMMFPKDVQNKLREFFGK